MTKITSRKNKSIASTWIFNYVLIMVVSLVFFFAAYITSGKIISEQTQQFNEQIFDITSNNTVDIIGSMHKISREISADSAINAVFLENDSNNLYSNAQINTFRRSIEELVQYNTAVEMVYFYVPHMDCVVSDRGIFDTKTFYTTYINTTTEDYDRWKKSYTNNEKEDFISKLLLGNGGVYVAHNVRFSQDVYGEKKTGYITVIANEDEFFGTKNINSQLNVGDIYIYDNNGELLISRNVSGKHAPRKVSELKKVKKDRTIISGAVSADDVSMYIAMSVPEKNMVEKEHLLDWFFIIYLILQILIVIPLIRKLVKANYTPIREILNIFDIKNTENEYKQLQQCINSIVREKRTLEKENRKQNDTLKQTQLSKLLTERSVMPGTYELLGELGVDFRYGKFAVIGLDIDDPNRLFDTYDDMTDDERYNYLNLIISNVFEEALSTEKSVAYVTEAEKILVCIINFDCDEGVLEKKAVFASDFVHTNFDVKISYLFSGIHNDKDDIHSAYREMMSVLEYKLLFELEGNFTYDTTNELCGVQYGFGDDLEQKFVAAVKNGAYEEAKNLITQIFSNIKSEKNVSYKYIKVLIFDIIASVLKITDSLGLDRNDVMSDLERYEKNFRSVNLDELQENILEYVNGVCSYVASESSKDQTVIVEKIEKYVQEHYSDTTLSIASIGETFGMTGSYLSKKFKAVNGELLVNYISRYRIEMAKQFMRETDYNRDTIAEMVGIGHPRTFNRLFKKYEGITPTEYKDKIGENL